VEVEESEEVVEEEPSNDEATRILIIDIKYS
jgi:hypothetical protein